MDFWPFWAAWKGKGKGANMGRLDGYGHGHFKGSAFDIRSGGNTVHTLSRLRKGEHPGITYYGRTAHLPAPPALVPVVGSMTLYQLRSYVLRLCLYLYEINEPIL